MSDKRVAVVGAGVAGLSAARAILAADPTVELLVLERAERVGGLVETERRDDGFVIEHGPDCLVTHKPAGMRLARELGLGESFVGGTGAPRRSFLARGDGLSPMPTGLLAMGPTAAWSIMWSSLLSVSGRARLTLEPFVPRRKDDEDESVASFFRRRFGDEMVEGLVDPLLRGIYATPTDSLSMRAAMPRMMEMEKVHGSVAIGMAKARIKRRSAGGDVPAAVTFPSGMSALTDALRDELGDRVRCGVEVSSIGRAGTGFELSLADGGRIEADGVVVAAPAFVAARMLEGVSPDLASRLADFEYAPHLSISFAWPEKQVPHPMDGTGFLVPAPEDRSITACTWVSRKWPERAPAGSAHLKVFGRTHDAVDEEVIELALGELRDLMGITERPAMSCVRRRKRLLPRRAVGHVERADEASRVALEAGPLVLAGNARGCVGIPECIESGGVAAQSLLRALGR